VFFPATPVVADPDGCSLSSPANSINAQLSLAQRRRHNRHTRVDAMWLMSIAI
jgi:hypothetical protein